MNFRMNKLLKKMMVVLLSLDLAQAVLADDVPDFQETLQTAEQGYAAAQYNLGVMYAHGLGVRQHDAQAAQWFRKAAEQGVANAQYNLGLMYAYGQGVRQNYKSAKEWLGKACDNGLQQSCDAYRELNQAGY